MTPKEKALELVTKCGLVAINTAKCIRPESSDIAKQCALIAVDEILGLCWNGNEDAQKYWQEVKTEIEKL